MARVASIWRHPIKSHGRQSLNEVLVAVGKTLPWDRAWAVAHEASKADGSAWVPCANFSRGAKAPSLMAISADFDEETQRITLTHPDRPDLTFAPDGDTSGFLDWVHPLMPENRAQSARILRVPGVGLTDTDFPSISLNSLASNQSLSQHMGVELSQHRWRGNIWLEGLAPWQEFDWIGKRIRIGDAELDVREPITRCLATTANPDTGLRDAQTLVALKEGWGHQNFGVYAVVTKAGRIAHNDQAELI